jgi:hypothetical protein
MKEGRKVTEEERKVMKEGRKERRMEGRKEGRKEVDQGSEESY